MRATDAQLRILVAAGDQAAVKELRERVRWQAIRALPNPTGTCAAGRAIYVDQRGTYSSGYVLHAWNNSICDHKPWAMDDDSPRAARLRTIVEECRPIA